MFDFLAGEYPETYPVEEYVALVMFIFETYSTLA